MRRILTRERSAATAAILLSVLLALVAGWVPDSLSAVQIPGDTATPAPAETTSNHGATVLATSGTPTRAGMEERRTILRPTLPASATQADRGAQVYNLVCSACHAYSGEGLTDEWRATWAPEDQNCWQTKCHGPSHPPDGFDLPRYVPPAVGPAVIGRFRTALDLFEYTKAEMPWHEPDSLQEDEYWEVTAFLVRLMGVDPVRVPLDRQRAAELLLRPGQNEGVVGVPSSVPSSAIGSMIAPTPIHGSPTPHSDSQSVFPNGNRMLRWLPLLVLAITGLVVGIAAGALLTMRSRRQL